MYEDSERYYLQAQRMADVTLELTLHLHGIMRCVRLAIARLREISAEVADSQLQVILQREIEALKSKFGDGHTT